MPVSVQTVLMRAFKSSRSAHFFRRLTLKRDLRVDLMGATTGHVNTVDTAVSY